MSAAVLCPDNLNATLRPELAIAPIKRTTANAPVAYSTGSPNSKVASDPGAKKSMIRPITQGIPRFTPVDIHKQKTPIVISFHCGLANSNIRMMEATSGVSSFFLSFFVVVASFVSGVPEVEVGSATSDGRVVTRVEGEGGVLTRLLSGLGVAISGCVLGSAALEEVELKRSDERTDAGDACCEGRDVGIRAVDPKHALVADG